MQYTTLVLESTVHPNQHQNYKPVFTVLAYTVPVSQD